MIRIEGKFESGAKLPVSGIFALYSAWVECECQVLGKI